MTRAFVFLLILLAAVVGFAQFVRRTSMFFPDKLRGDAKPPGAEDVWFTTSDGVKLHGWLFRARDANAPMIVWCHGNGGHIGNRADVAIELARRGLSVFLFDWRGYGRSEGSPTEAALFHDALAAYDVAVAQLGARDVVPYGESLGGPYAAHIAKHRKVRCVVIENSFPSLKDLGNALYAPIPLGLTAPFALRTADWLNDAGVPVLVLHGRRDQVIPYRLGKQLYDELTVKKELHTCDDAGHCEIPFVDSQRYYDVVTRFVHTAAR